MTTIGILLTLAAFLAAFLGIFAVNLVFVDIFQRDREATLERLNEELMQQQRQRARESTKSRSGTLDEIIEEAAREAHNSKGIFQRLEETVMQSGLTISPAKLLSTCAIVGLLLILPIIVFTANFVIAGAVGGVGAAIPLLYVSAARKKRLEALRSQLPDAFELMSRTLRAGQSITQGIKAVSEEFKPPVKIEFGYCYEQQNLGLAPEVALHDLAQRTGLLEIKIFVLAVLVHRQAGGNLTEMLDNIANVVRARFRLRTEVRSLTAEGRMQAAILLGLPIAMWFALFFISRDYALKLFQSPMLITATLASMVVGAVWIRKIVNFEI